MAFEIVACPPERYAELDAVLADGFASLRGVPASLRFPHVFGAAEATVFVAIDDDDRIVGSTAVRVCHVDRGRSDFAMIGLVLTMPDLRGRGLGSALVRHADAHAGTESTVLWTSRHGFYARLGWTSPADTGRVALAVGDGGAGRPGPPDASAQAAIEALRNSEVRRAPAAYRAVPAPGLAVEAHFDPAGRAYALVSATRERAFVVDMDGDPAGFPGVWASLTATHRSLLVNAEGGSAAERWLRERAGLDFAPQQITMWRGPEGAYVPWFDRI